MALPKVEREQHEPFDALSLYEIESEIKAVMQQCINDEGELLDDVDARLDSLNISREKKLLSYAAVIKSIKYAAEAIHAIENRLKEKRWRYEARRNWLREKVAASMTPNEKIKDHRASVRCKATTKWEVFDESLVPRKFFREVTSVVRDDEAIEFAIANGELVPGVDVTLKKGIVVS